MKSLERKIKHVKGIVHNKLDNENVIFNPQTEALHILNREASLIWEFCNNDFSIEEVIKCISDKLEIDEVKISKNVKECIDNFLEYKLVEFK